MQHTAKRWSTLQHTATSCNKQQQTSTHRDTLHRTAPHCNTLQHRDSIKKESNTLHPNTTHCTILQHTASHCNTLQHTAKRYNSLHSTITTASIRVFIQSGPEDPFGMSFFYRTTPKLSSGQICLHSVKQVGYGSQNQLFDTLQWGKWQAGQSVLRADST